MKKTKIIMISLLGLLLLVPFMRPSIAQFSYYVGVEVGDVYEFDLNIYVGPTLTLWNPWFDDNMTAFWGEPFGHSSWDNMTAVYGMTDKTPAAPQFTWRMVIDSIVPDKDGFDTNFDEVVNVSDPLECWDSPGNSLVQTTKDTSYVNMNFPDYIYTNYWSNGRTFFINNETAGFAEDIAYGALCTTVIWASNLWYMGMFNFDLMNSHSIFFAPTTVNWTEFATECNTGLEATYDLAANYTYTLTVSELPNGFSMYSPVMGFGNNSQSITINSTYGTDGVMTYHSFEYGSTLLYDLTIEDSADPVITDTPVDFAVPHNYTGVTIEWTATDDNPYQYGITRNGTGVLPPTSWTSGVEVSYPVPDDLPSGDHLFRVGFTDERGHVVYDEVIMTVGPHPVPPPPPIPGYEPLVVMGIVTAVTMVIIIRMKKKK